MSAQIINLLQPAVHAPTLVLVLGRLLSGILSFLVSYPYGGSVRSGVPNVARTKVC